jgi:FkbM family methyltransferase
MAGIEDRSEGHMPPIIRKIENLTNRFLRTWGLRIARNELNPSWYERLNHMKTLGFSPQLIFDCGAFLGEWTLGTASIFPNAQFLLVEPNKLLINATKANISKIKPEPILLEVAVGEEAKSGYLNVWAKEPTSMVGSSILSHVQGEANVKIETPITTLDAICEKFGHVPDLVKLDLQGAELAALRGARLVLGTAELFIVEFGCLEAYIGRTTPRDLIDIMYDSNYCLYDVVDLIHRPYDGALTGGDFFFIKNDSPLRKHKGYV